MPSPKTATFTPVTSVDEVTQLVLESRVLWCRTPDGKPKKALVNSAVRRWESQPDRIIIPIKWWGGLYDTFDESDVTSGRVLRRIDG